MTNTLDGIYSDVMLESLSKIYYKYVFTKEHFDVYFFMREVKLNNITLEVFSQQLYSLIPEKNINILLKKQNKDQIMTNIRSAIQEIFDMFSSSFSTRDEFEDLPFILEQFDCESRSENVFFDTERYNSENLYIEKYLRVVDKDVNTEIQRIVSSRDGSLKNVCKVSDFINYLETDQTLNSLVLVPRSFNQDSDSSGFDPGEGVDDTLPINPGTNTADLININKLSPFSSITQGVRLIYLANEQDISNNINISSLRQNSFFQKEKCWALFGRTNANQQQNSIVKYPFEIARSESVNLIELYQENLVKKIKNTISYNDLNRKLLESLIINNNYKHFFEQIIPLKLINIMNYAHFKKMSRMMRETIEKNNVFGNMDSELFKLINQFIEYKEFVK